MLRLLVLASALLPHASPAGAATEGARKVAVLRIEPKAGFDADRAELFNEFLQNELRGAGHTVIGRSDIEALVGLEKLKDALACDTTSCMAEIGGALGVDEIITGAIGKLDPYLLITLKRLSPKEGRVLKQATEKLADAGDRQLVDSIPRLVAQLYDLKPPQPAPPAEAAAPAPAPVRTAKADLDIRDLHQGVQFVFDGGDEERQVSVRTSKGELACPAPVSFIRPCTLPIEAGPVEVLVEDESPHHVTVEPGRNVYYVDTSNYIVGYLGIGALAVGAGLGAVALAKSCPEDNAGCSAVLLPAIAGGIVGYAGVIMTAIGFATGGSSATIEPMDSGSSESGSEEGVYFEGIGAAPLPGGAVGAVRLRF